MVCKVLKNYPFFEKSNEKSSLIGGSIYVLYKSVSFTKVWCQRFKICLRVLFSFESWNKHCQKRSLAKKTERHLTFYNQSGFENGLDFPFLNFYNSDLSIKAKIKRQILSRVRKSQIIICLKEELTTNQIQKVKQQTSFRGLDST